VDQAARQGAEDSSGILGNERVRNSKPQITLIEVSGFSVQVSVFCFSSLTPDTRHLKPSKLFEVWDFNMP
jgi:hypothetical protein